MQRYRCAPSALLVFSPRASLRATRMSGRRKSCALPPKNGMMKRHVASVGVSRARPQRHPPPAGRATASASTVALAIPCQLSAPDADADLVQLPRCSWTNRVNAYAGSQGLAFCAALVQLKAVSSHPVIAVSISDRHFGKAQLGRCLARGP